MAEQDRAATAPGAEGHTRLRLEEAVELGHGLVQWLAGQLGVRVIFLKGRTLHEYGLREPRSSADVDVLVEPGGFDALCAALEGRGWRPRPSNFISEHSSRHSRPFIHAEWPCDIDVHWNYPGFLRPPHVVFEELWQRRRTAVIGGRECVVPDRSSSILILALHALRSPDNEERHRRELGGILRLPLKASAKADLADVAAATGCAATLESVLPAMGVGVVPPPEELASQELREWRESIASGSRGSYLWVRALRHATWPGRLLILWRAIWPTDADLAAVATMAPEPGGMVRARLVRWKRGVASLPRALRAVAQARRADRARRADPVRRSDPVRRADPVGRSDRARGVQPAPRVEPARRSDPVRPPGTL